jgi:uncharacterized damage-inducible protein DinB
MKFTSQIAKHLREVYTGGNWTTSNVKDVLADLTWEEATTRIYDLNTIATLLYHTNYYVDVISRVLKGGKLEGKDELSFNHPPVRSADDWEKLRDKVLRDAETFSSLIETLPDDKLWEDFTDKKYGLYLRHLLGFIEHMHYHLGQIAIIKKIIRQKNIN